ncbi:polyphosphate--glucose phosphotransferase [Yinghuangia soli]|uniref:ROK family protein n=1 Tax=Yinghuangia soli TaxID=2908204 RepID=A0AA41Q9C5_9ACTN|nr:ROK family protein [Yinghuangia soli]MCF2532587.1 ROK family protein [Yinghuangia soli]
MDDVDTCLGIDIGGTGIKGAPVDTAAGRLLHERVRQLTPHPSEPEAVLDVVRDIVARFSWRGPVGITFPGVVFGGITRTAANVDKGWVDLDARKLFSESLHLPVTVVNDADAAGIAEMRCGVGQGRTGTVLLLTFGTGIGSALFRDGVLVPNTEFGHLELNGHEAEHHASGNVREEHNLSWEHWAHRVQRYLQHLEMLFSPDLFVIGGGVSKKADKFLPHIKHVRAEIVPASLHNDAGIVGAALAARTECGDALLPQSQQAP